MWLDDGISFKILLSFSSDSYFFVHTESNRPHNKPTAIVYGSRRRAPLVSLLGFAPFGATLWLPHLRKTSRAAHAQDDREGTARS